MDHHDLLSEDNELIIPLLIPHFHIDVLHKLSGKYLYILNQPSVLSDLSHKFKLTRYYTTFPEFLSDYDKKYATIRSYQYDNRIPEEIFLQAATEGDLPAILYGLSELNIEAYNDALINASGGGHLEIVKIMLKCGAMLRSMAADAAADNGHIDIIKLLIDHGAWTYESFACRAARNGHINIVVYLVENYEIDNFKVACLSVIVVHINIVELFLDDLSEIRQYDILMKKAAKRNHMDIVHMMIEHDVMKQ